MTKIVQKSTEIEKTHKTLQAIWNLHHQLLFSRFKCLLKGSPQVSLPRMTFVKSLLITWCPETWGDNSRLFTTWWMRSPLCPEPRLQPSHRKKMRPLSILFTPFSWKWPLHAQTNTHRHTHTLCGGNRSRLRSTKGNTDQWELSQQSSGLLYITGRDC